MIVNLTTEDGSGRYDSSGSVELVLSDVPDGRVFWDITGFGNSGSIMITVDDEEVVPVTEYGDDEPASLYGQIAWRGSEVRFAITTESGFWFSWGHEHLDTNPEHWEIEDAEDPIEVERTASPIRRRSGGRPTSQYIVSDSTGWDQSVEAATFAYAASGTAAERAEFSGIESFSTFGASGNVGFGLQNTGDISDTVFYRRMTHEVRESGFFFQFDDPRVDPRVNQTWVYAGSLRSSAPQVYKNGNITDGRLRFEANQASFLLEPFVESDLVVIPFDPEEYFQNWQTSATTFDTGQWRSGNTTMFFGKVPDRTPAATFSDSDGEVEVEFDVFDNAAQITPPPTLIWPGFKSSTLIVGLGVTMPAMIERVRPELTGVYGGESGYNVSMSLHYSYQPPQLWFYKGPPRPYAPNTEPFRLRDNTGRWRDLGPYRPADEPGILRLWDGTQWVSDFMFSELPSAQGVLWIRNETDWEFGAFMG